MKTPTFLLLFPLQIPPRTTPRAPHLHWGGDDHRVVQRRPTMQLHYEWEETDPSVCRREDQGSRGRCACSLCVHASAGHLKAGGGVMTQQVICVSCLVLFQQNAFYA